MLPAVRAPSIPGKNRNHRLRPPAASLPPPGSDRCGLSRGGREHRKGGGRRASAVVRRSGASGQKTAQAATWGAGALESQEAKTGKEPPAGRGVAGRVGCGGRVGCPANSLLGDPPRRDSVTELVLLTHSLRWDLENLGGVRIKLRTRCVRSSGKPPNT